MTIVLSGLDLNKEMVWTDRFTSVPTPTTFRATLGGKQIALPARRWHRLITLLAGEDHGWLTRTQVESLIAMAEVPNGQYELTYYGTVVPVRFAIESPPAVDMQPLILAANPASGAYFIGTVKLITL